MPVPSAPWDQIHIDFVTELPADDGHTTVMTVVDRFSKMASFVPLRATDAKSVADAFFRQVVAQHGLPLTITSDRDPRFTGKFWREVMEKLHTNL